VGQFVVWKMIREALSKDDSHLAWSLFNGLRAKTLPAPELTSSLLMHCAKQNLSELAFKTYSELQAQGMPAHHMTHSALLCAAGKQKSYYPRAVELFREMEGTGMPLDIRVFNNMLQATAKVGDVPTALELWNRLQEDTVLKINEITVANMLWSLAAVETEANKISKRLFHYDMNPADLKQAAVDVFESAQKNHGIAPNAYVMNAYLAVMSNHNFVPDAESVFHDTFKTHNLTQTPASYEIMLKMYDTQRDFPKASTLLEAAKSKGLALGFEAWRAAVRTAALTKNLPTAIQWLREMAEAGHKPSVDSMRVLHLRLCEEEKWQLRREMGEICLPPASLPHDPYTSMRKRSVAIAELLAKVYGKKAPKLATKQD